MADIKMYTVKAAADHLGKTPARVYQYLNEGDLTRVAGVAGKAQLVTAGSVNSMAKKLDKKRAA